MWPLATSPYQLTAAQAMILAESLRNSKGDPSIKPTRGVRNQPRVSRAVLEELARQNNSLDGSR